DVDVDAADLLLAARLHPHLRRLLAAGASGAPLAGPLQLVPELLRLARARVQQGIRLARGDRLDPASPRADRALGDDYEGADPRRRPHVRAAAELTRVAGDLDEPDLVTVLLAEEHHRAEPARLVDRDDERAHRHVLEDPLVHLPLDLASLLGSQRLRVREVEAQLVRPDGRARLARVLAEH